MGRFSHSGPLDVGAVLTCPLSLQLASGDRRFNPGKESTAVGSQISLAVGRDKQEPSRLRRVNPVLQLSWLTGEAVKIPTNNCLEKAPAVVCDHFVVSGPAFRHVGCALRLIYILLEEFPAFIFQDLHAVFALPLDCETVHFAV